MIRIERVESPPRRATKALFQPGRVTVGIGDRMARKRYDRDELLVSIENSIRQHRAGATGAPVGRWVGRMFGGQRRTAGAETIQLDGQRLGQLLELAGERASQQVSVTAQYSVGLQDVERCLRIACHVP